MGYLKRNQPKQAQRTPQREPIIGEKMIPNSAGGYAYALDQWDRLERFLILGSETGSYYVSERKLTAENAANVARCIAEDGERVVQHVINISQAGRAPKQDPAIFVLAMCAASQAEATRKAAYAALPQVCRIGTHLLHFVDFVDGMRGWGRGLRRAVAQWYTTTPAEQVAFQAVKYQQRDGWSQRDVLRMSHAVPPTPEHNVVFNWITKGWPSVGEEPHPLPAAKMIWAFERAKVADKAELLHLITDYRLPREALPTQWLTNADVWAAMLPHLGLTAVLRNLANMTRIGLLVPGSTHVGKVREMITNHNQLAKARIHPISVLSALLTYGQGRGVRGSGEWTPHQSLVDALDEAFYKTFALVTPTKKRILLALDVSGSMSWGNVGGVPNLTPRVASAAMAMITAASEHNYHLLGFSNELVKLPISPRQRLDDVVKIIEKVPMGGTDCALPMLWAHKNKVDVDAFVIYTDSETWYGDIHPSQALRTYRDKRGIAAKLIVVGMMANAFTIADPNDGGMMDVVGFDSTAPVLMSDFIRAS